MTFGQNYISLSLFLLVFSRREYERKREREGKGMKEREKERKGEREDGRKREREWERTKKNFMNFSRRERGKK